MGGPSILGVGDETGWSEADRFLGWVIKLVEMREQRRKFWDRDTVFYFVYGALQMLVGRFSQKVLVSSWKDEIAHEQD